MTTLGKWNDVRGTGGRWKYTLKIRHADGSLAFEVYRADGIRIVVVGVSPYRTTTLARRMGDDREGYETEARRVIRAHEERE